MEDYKKIGVLHRLGIYLFPYIFGWSVIKGNYSPTAKAFTKIYMFFIIGLLFVAVVTALPSPKNNENVNAVVDGKDVAIAKGANVSKATDARTKISFNDKSVSIYKKFIGVYGTRPDSTTTNLYAFREDGLYIDVPDSLAEKLGTKTVTGREIFEEYCDEKSDNYGNIGDEDQLIGLNLAGRSKFKDAYYYQIVCHDEGGGGVLFVAADMNGVYALSRCSKDECEIGELHPEISGLIYFEEQSNALPFTGEKSFVNEQYNFDGTFLAISEDGNLRVEHPSRIRVDREDAIYEAKVDVIYDGKFFNPFVMKDGSLVHIKKDFVTIESNGKLERLELFESGG